MINTGLDSFSANNIRSTHFAIGPGGQARPTEQRDVYFAVSPRDAHNKLHPERIEFFKASHFRIGSEDSQAQQMAEKTTTTRGFPAYSDIKKPNSNACVAYQVRHGRTQIGSQDPKYPTPYVTSGQIQQRWI